jgi:hypothetical protein
MKCALYECDKEASPPFPCCGMTHGVRYKQEARDFEDYAFSLLPLSNWIGQANLKSWSIKKWEYMRSRNQLDSF